jgi:predicted nucleic acid-binding protein
MVVLDTDILVAQLRGYPDALKKISELIEEGVLMRVSIISVFELLDGAHKSKNPGENIARVDGALSDLEVLPLDMQQAKIAAEMFNILEKKRQKVDEFDVLIGASALAHGDLIVTRNIDHFGRIPGLKVERW